MTIPTIETERLLLRPYRLEDASDYARHIFSDADVMRFMNVEGKVPQYPFLQAKSYIVERNRQWDRRGYGAWALVEKATDRFMGHVGLFIIDNTDVIEVGYALGRTFWGNGYATEAAHATLRYGFDVVGLDEIVAVAFPENTASLRVMEKVGMTSQGITDRYYDVMLACYTLTRADFEKQNAR
ncbi:MAG: GNAT family N-acetyltransferase [Chloroflexota bacterium]